MTQTLLSTTVTLAGLTVLLSASAARGEELTTDGPERVPARAGTFTVKVEPGLAFPLTRPQSRLFDMGGSQTVKALWTLKPYLDLGPSVTVLALPAEAASREAGAAWTFGGGVRFKRPHHAPDRDAFYAISPWADADLLYVRTGELDRPGFAAAVGLSVPVGAARAVWIGPFLRYFQILQGTRSGYDDRDAKLLSLGLSLEVGSAVERERHTVVTDPVETRRVHPDPILCPDRDQDGISDHIDRCPDVAGPIENWGCRSYEKVVVRPDKLELKERLYFAWDQTTLLEDSFPVLDDVVRALNDNRGFRVKVEGHASSEGTDSHNQTLSEQRAEAVLDYLVAHGVAKDRLVSKGFSSSVPADTNETAAGRENNRRVEFVVNFIIIDEGSK
ncbi:MAG: OmpA family protein [Polyangiaceae bacterium]|nr:OmpA family protein [Polyangiaceae bacterium]